MSELQLEIECTISLFKIIATVQQNHACYSPGGCRMVINLP